MVPGYLTKNFNQFATEGSIDESLTWIYEVVAVKDTNTFESVGGEYTNLSTWDYAKKKNGDKQGYATDETTDISQALVTYLKFTNGDINTTFDYSPNVDVTGQNARPATVANGVTYSATGVGEGTMRLVTETGWSTAELYQDYSYGKNKSAENPETYYEDHRDDGNLAYLFSGSTFIEVVDDYTVDVNVIKTDDGKGDATKYLQGAKFILYKKDDENNKLYYKKDNLGNVTWELNDRDNAYVFETTTDKAYFTIEDISEGQYYLEEIKAPDGYLTLAEPIEFMIDYKRDEHNQVTGYGVIIDEKYNPRDITYVYDDPYYNENSNAIQYKLTVVNQNRGIDVEVNKLGCYYEDGELTEPVELSGAEFKLYYIEEVEGVEVKKYFKTANEYVGSVWTDDREESYTFASEENGNTFIISNLQNGTYYLEEVVVPKNFTPPLYKTVITVDLESTENKVTVQYSGDDTVTEKTIQDEDENEITVYSINVINTPGFELPKTGGIGNYLVYTIGIMLILAGAGGYILNKKYVKEKGGK